MGSSMRFVVNTSHIFATSEAKVGGKAKNLFWMQRQGFNVPAFIVVTTEAFQHCLSQLMQRSYEDMMRELQSAPLATAQKIREAFLKNPLPQTISLALQPLLASLGKGYLAVRSSVVGEDSVEASFAGQMESYLFLKSTADIERAVMDCFASAFADRAIQYRLDRKLPIHAVAAAVVCQDMIESEVSGVLFTAHPNTGRRDQQLLSVAWGLGEGVVSGECNADEFIINWNGDRAEISDRRITVKDQAVRFKTTFGKGTELCPVPPAQQQIACMSDEDILKLGQAAHRMAILQGCPQDVEFALLGGTIYFLQTRPITKLPVETTGQSTVWDNSNIQESYCGVTTPLTYSFANRAYRNVYLNTAEIIGMHREDLADLETELRNLLGLIRGRVYYNINNWYKGISSLPGFAANKADMERMMGLQDPVDFIENRKPKGIEALGSNLKKIRTLIKLLGKFFKIRQLVAEFRSNFAEVYLKVDKSRLFLSNMSQLYQLSREVEMQLIMRWTTPIVNDFYVMMMNGKVFRKLSQLGFENPSLTLNNLLSGEEGIESTEPTKFLLGLCDLIRVDHELVRTFAEASNQELMVQIQIKFPKFYEKCCEYIELYGDRTMGELKLESITLRQDPAFMFACLKNYLANPKLSLSSLQRHEMDLRHSEEKRVFGAAKGWLARTLLKRDLERLRNAVKNRENMRLARTRMFGLFRCIYLEIGQQLAMHRQLEHGRDIFYLTVEEIEQLFEGRSVTTHLHGLVEIRKKEFAAHLDHELPHHFATFGSPYVGNSYEYQGQQKIASEGEALQGLGCYPGIVEGRVRLIFSPDEELSLQGQILCTVRTDPGWAPLFPSASGIIVERGSSLSHSAVVARELGIPAIVNIPGLTKILKDGDWIRMNGQTGLIERLDEPK
jgi:phosphohistidine swiveling domain-containing protein